jgi:hypothetical protein
VLTAFLPQLLNYSQYILIDFPWDFGEVIQDVEYTVIVGILYQPFLDGTVAKAHHIGSLRVVPSYFGL